MDKDITGELGITIGMDVSDRFTEAFAIDNHGEWIESWRMPTKQGALRDGLSRYPGARVVLEVGCHSPWISRQLKKEGFEVIVANPRRVRLIAESDRKSDSRPSCTAGSGRSATACCCSPETGWCGRARS
jgi:transposase